MFCLGFLVVFLYFFSKAALKKEVWYDTTNLIKISLIYVTNLYIGKYTAEFTARDSCVCWHCRCEVQITFVHNT